MSLQLPIPPEDAKSWQQYQGRPHRGRMPRKKQKVVLRLKNGEMADVRWALTERESLERLLRTHPQHFDVLLSLCKGHSSDTHDDSKKAWLESIDFLKKQYHVVRDDGIVDPLIKNVLLSSYHLTPDGPVMTQPFALTNQQDKQLADMIDRQSDQAVAKFVRDMLADDDKGRSR